MEDRMRLYKAVKHQVIEYAGDCGWNLVQLWAVVNNRGIDDDLINWRWWRDVVLEDYEHDVERGLGKEEIPCIG